MKKGILVLALLIIQIYLITRGVLVFSKLAVPFLLLIVSATLPFWYFKTMFSAGQPTTDTGRFIFQKKRLWGFLAGVFCILILWKVVANMFATIPDPGGSSDIIPQLTTLYTRFRAGIQPYYPLEQYPWHPYPVYMPLHWLPLALGYFLQIDVRWVGFIFMAASSGILGYCLWSPDKGIKKIIAISLPAVTLYCFILWAKSEVAVSYELVIAAYYLLVAAGLLGRNLVLVTMGIITCLLSRYTLVFWLPLFFILLWPNVPKKKSLLVWSAIVLAVLALYIIPFYLRDPSILSKGLEYHNKCYGDAWNGLGNPAASTAFDLGLNFSYFICHSLPGDMYHRVFLARIIQAALMIIIFLAGIILYQKWKHKISYTDFSLGMLCCFMIAFFMFSPVTYPYYYLPLLSVSSVLGSKILTA